ncbi:MAG: undecaprenyl-phosphate glucose phosphotransferase [Terriglobia bacterium]
MIRRRLNQIEFALRLSVLMLPLPAFVIAAYIRFAAGIIPLGFDARYIDPTPYFGLLLLAVLAWAVVVEHFDLARVDRLFPPRDAARNAFAASATAYTAVTAASFFYRNVSFSRLFVVISGVALFVLILFTQKVYRTYLDSLRQRGEKCSRLLVIGADEHAERALHSFLQSTVIPCSVEGFVRLPGQIPYPTCKPLLEFEALESMVVELRADDVLIAVPLHLLAEASSLVRQLERLSVPVRAILDLGPGISFRNTIFHFGDTTLLDLRATPSEAVAYTILKRTFDLVFATVVAILTAPLMLLIAAAIRLTSPGPVLFAQDRVGLNGRVFRVYKFRTMGVGNPGESDTRWTTSNDPRRTRLGAFLRATNLDELPQFFNVLKGDMSVVGPRPERPYFVKKFQDDVAQYNTRHYLKVGITGWAQVNGWRGDTSIAKRVEHDLYYLRNWSLWFDMKIIWLTLWRSFFSKNAY